MTERNSHSDKSTRSRASSCLASGEERLREGDYAEAIKAARQGLDALGDDYRVPTAKDDTGLKLSAAKDRIEQGHPSDAAGILLAVLRTRLEMFAEKQNDEVAR